MGLYNTLGAPIIIYVASDLMQLYLYMQFVSKIPSAGRERAHRRMRLFPHFLQHHFSASGPGNGHGRHFEDRQHRQRHVRAVPVYAETKLKTLTTFLMNYAGAQQASGPRWQPPSS